MRQPTTPAERWRWWEAALAGDPLPVYEDEPQAGFYRVRKFRYGEWVGGPWVPARVWWENGETDEEGALLSDETCRAEIDGKGVDPWLSWTWIAKHPITTTEWEWLRAMSPLLPQAIPSRNRSTQRRA